MKRDPLPPVLLGELRALGFPLFLSCPACNHSGEVAIEAFDGFPDELEVHDIGHAVRCTKCGRRGGASATRARGCGSRTFGRPASDTACPTGRR